MPDYTMHVVSHTHWDREFFLPFQEFRTMFVEMMDDLLDLLDRDPEFRFFHLDGQTVIIEDYLEIKPENEARIRAHVKNGRLLVGPRYQLNDHFLVSPEAHVRNYIIGVRMAEKLGGCMRVGYCADEFGLMSQYPQLLRGFDIDNAVFARGIYIENDRKIELIWESPDGSQVLGSFLAMWFNNAQNVPTDPNEADEVINRAKNGLGPISITPHLLLMNGVDQMAAQPDLSEAIRTLRERLKGDTVIHSTLPKYIEGIKQSLEESGIRPEVFRGELREDKYGHALAGTLSTRLYLKQANHDAQTLLERYTEPVCAFAWTLGMQYPWHMLDYTWKLLMKNHPHDSICGCSCDPAHREMESRFTQVTQVGNTLSGEAFNYLANEIKTDSDTLVVFNPLGWKRTDRVVAQVDFPLNKPFRGESPIDPSMDVEAFEMYDQQGLPVPFSVLDVSHAIKRLMSGQMIMHGQRMKRFTIEFIADDVPACGYKTYRIARAERFPESDGWSAKDLCGSDWLGNESLKVEFRNGSVNLKHPESGRTYSNLNTFEDCGEVGDEYRHIKPNTDVFVKTDNKQAKSELVRSSPISATWKVEQAITLPECAADDRSRRSGPPVACPITSYITVTRGIPRVDIRTEIENNAKDHRLRVVFPTGVKTDVTHAESQFDVITRPVKVPEDWHKTLASTWRPQLNWVDVNDGKAGFCLINTGLPEYEVYDDDDRTLALTLLRCVRELAILDNAHMPMPVPDAQCQGKRVFEYSILPHSGGWREAKVWKQAYQRNVPMRAVQTGAHDGDMPSEACLVEVEPVELIVTAVKRAEREDKLVVRFFNTTDETVEGKITVRGAKSAELMNLNEDPKQKLKIGPDGAILLSVGAKKIITLGFGLEAPSLRPGVGNRRPVDTQRLRKML